MLTYFLQVNVCWLLFYGAYYALLSKETFFRLNRLWLIISLLCGLVIPVVVPKMNMLIVQPLVEVVQPITVSVAQMQELLTVQTIETQPTTLGIWTILMKLYSLGVAFFLLKFCWGLVTIFKLYQSGKKVKNSDFSLIYTEGVKTPFSFFNWIFVNQNTIESADFQHIITHEQTHVRQKHSFDILGLEILRGAFWLSPLVHLYARSLRNVHEYLADAAVLQNTQKQSYGRLLINQTAAGNGLVLANHLNFSQLKKRIIMMSRNPSQRVALVKYTFAAPIFLLIVALLASPKTKVLANTEGVVNKFESVIEKIDNQLFKNKNNKPVVTIRNTEDGWVLPQDLDKVVALDINEGYEIIEFNVAIPGREGYASKKIHHNKGSFFERKLRRRINDSQVKDYFRFTDIMIKDLKNNDIYNYGDCYLNVVNKIPRNFINTFKTLKLATDDGRMIESGKIDIHDMPRLNRFILDVKSIDSFKIRIFSKQKSLEDIEIQNDGLSLSESTKKYLKQAQIGDIIMFSVRGYNGEDFFSFYANLIVIDESNNEPPFLSIAKRKEDAKMTVHDFTNIDYVLAKQVIKDKDEVLKIVSLNVVRIPANKNEATQTVKNEGINLKEQALSLIKKAQKGDVYQFTNAIVFDEEHKQNIALKKAITFTIE